MTHTASLVDELQFLFGPNALLLLRLDPELRGKRRRAPQVWLVVGEQAHMDREGWQER